MPYDGEHRKTGGKWKIEMLEAPCLHPVQCLFGCICAPCASYSQRMQLLGSDTTYFCCNKQYPICGLDKKEYPLVPCLACEVCFCLSCSVASNRATIQQRFKLQNTFCDECLLWSTCALSWIVCLCEMTGHQVDPRVRNLIDCLYYSVLGCMNAQQDAEMDPNFTRPAPAQQTMK